MIAVLHRNFVLTKMRYAKPLCLLFFLKNFFLLLLFFLFLVGFIPWSLFLFLELFIEITVHPQKMKTKTIMNKIEKKLFMNRFF